jgi:broad specificity phosphatase PhoE
MDQDGSGVRVFAIRHGESAWSLNGRHTGKTDLPLTGNGRLLAERMRPVLMKTRFALVLVSPMRRAKETCELAGLGGEAEVDDDLMEWRYGACEGLTSAQIKEKSPGWMIFRDGCPDGETPGEVSVRADRVIARARGANGTVALFAHGHILRVVAARWIGFSVAAGQHFILGTGTLSVLGNYQDSPAIETWNGGFVG